MSCGNNTNSCDCTIPTPPTSASGVKISQLDQLYQLSGNDLFVVVDVSNNKTNNVQYDTIIHYNNSGTSISAVTFQDAITELDIKIESISGADIPPHNELQGLQGGTSGEYYHLTEDEYDVVISITSGDGLVPRGGEPDQVLAKISSADYDYEWIDNTGAGIEDTPDDGNTYIREYDNWVQFDPSLKADTSALDNYTPTSAFDNHINDSDIHFEMSAIDHTLIQNIGTNTHSQIDTHISNNTIHAPLNDTTTSSSSLWSSQKIQDELDDKEDYLGTPTLDGQVLASSGSDVRYWVSMSGGLSDVPDNNTYIRTHGSWIQSDQFNTSGYYNNVEIDQLLTNYTTSGDFENHVNDTDIHFPMSAIDGLVISGGTKGQALVKNTNTDYDYDWQNILLPDGSVELDPSYIVSAAGDYGLVNKQYVDYEVSTHKSIRTVEFIGAGGVNNDIILETHSAFTNKSGFSIPSNEYEVYIIGIRLYSSTSYNNGNPDNVELRLATLPQDHDKPFGFISSPTTDNGTQVYYNNTVLDNVEQSGTKYNFVHELEEDPSNPFPIKLTPGLILFCEFHPNYWTFTDLQISILYTINKVI